MGILTQEEELQMKLQGGGFGYWPRAGGRGGKDFGKLGRCRALLKSVRETTK